MLSSTRQSFTAAAQSLIHPGWPHRLWLTLLLVAWMSFLGCITAPAWKTLYAVGKSTDAAVQGYFDLVIDGKVRTNDVPRIAKMYDRFQAVYRIAEKAAEFSPTAKADTNIIAMSTKLIAETVKAKGAQ